LHLRYACRVLARVKAETAAVGRARNTLAMDNYPDANEGPGGLQMRGSALAVKGSKQAPTWHMQGLQFKHM
jgi:hypothetical protein